MKIQYLTIVFIIIILPIILVTSMYNRLQINTIQLQKDYDDKLITATYDTMKAFQINTENNEYSTTSDSKRRDIEAAIETFLTSVTTGLGIGGYGTEYIKPYIPAILFTMYDGYYIYAPTYIADPSKPTIEHTLKPFISYSQRYVSGNIDVVINYTLDNYITVYGKIGTEYVRKSGYLNFFLLNENLNEEDEKEVLSERLFVTKESFASKKTVEYECWTDVNYLYVIKYIDPYTNYQMFFVPKISYSDNYYTRSESKKQLLNIVGNEKEYYYYDDEASYQRYYYNDANNRWFALYQEEIVRISDSTVLDDSNKLPNVSFELSNIDYTFDTSRINDNDYVEGFIKEYKYRYVNNQKYYYDEERRQEFTYLDCTKRYRPEENVDYVGDSSYYRYAADSETGSKEFTRWVVDNLGNLQISNARGEGNADILYFEGNTERFLNINENNKPEEANSIFNNHKKEVIRLTIEKNLLIAINNYDQNSVALDSSYNFRMPVIQESQWDRIISNVSVVTFMQGLPMGFKTYNNYAIVTSSTNEEHITEDGIYFLDDTHSTYHIIGCEELELTDNVIGYRNNEFERAKATIKGALSTDEETSVYYYKHNALPCYYCIVNRLASRTRNIFDSTSVDYTWTNSNNSSDDAQTRRNKLYKALGRERDNIVL